MSSSISLPRAYIETNFVLELAYGQAEQASCHEVLDACDAGELELCIPAFSFAEPFYAFIGREKGRKRVADDLTAQMRELRRGPLPSDIEDAMVEVSSFLAVSLDQERKGLRDAVEAIASRATLLPLSREVFSAAAELEDEHGLTPADAIVLASVLSHLRVSPTATSVFLNRNKKDFEDPDIDALLRALNCKLMATFGGGLAYLRAASK
ncbi:MAG TPA: hypothetical protein VGS57_18730 [Thermoanaerobaculia bacterium]|jgi:predicted nucleic acid-binding protein|nr:hypothetical protein [Thermoanaerobaculia bacterium]